MSGARFGREVIPSASALFRPFHTGFEIDLIVSFLYGLNAGIINTT